jgi:hypothetical protein
MEARYLQEHTAGSIIRLTLRLYLRHFGVLVLVSLPLLPFRLVQQIEATLLNVVGAVGYVLVYVPTWLATTVVVSDVCVGNRPRVVRSYRRGLGRRSLRVFATYALWLAFVGLGLLPILTGQILAETVGVSEAAQSAIVAAGVAVGLAVAAHAFSRYMLTFQVIALESIWGWQAMQRSRALGQGHYARNLGVVLLCVSVVTMIIAVPAAVAYLLTSLFSGSERAAGMILSAVFVLLGPLFSIGTVLVYYDMRVRKEAYDLDTLVADLGFEGR